MLNLLFIKKKTCRYLSKLIENAITLGGRTVEKILWVKRRSMRKQQNHMSKEARK